MSLVNQTFPLFKPPYVKFFFACSFLQLGTFAVAGGLALFLPEILNRLAKHQLLGGAEDLRVCDVLQMRSELQPSRNDSNLAEYVSRIRSS